MPFLIDARALTDKQPGGVTRVTQHLFQALTSLAPPNSLTFVTSGFNTPFKSSLFAPHPSQHLRLPNKLIALSTFLNLTSFDRLTPGTFDAVFLPNLEMVGRPRLPYALLVHDLSFFIEPRWFPFKSRLWHRLTRAKALIKNANTLLTVSDRTKEDLGYFLNIPSERIQTIPLGQTNLPLHTEADLPPAMAGQPYFLALGTNDPRKNISCVISAFQELIRHPKYQNIKLVLIGKTDHADIALNYSIPHTSLFTLHSSRAPDALLRTLMRHATALLYPSWYEGYGLPLHETAVYGTPIIASTAGALPETAPQGTKFAPPFKPHLWTQAMHDVLIKPQSTKTPVTNNWSQAANIILETLQTISQKTKR